MKILSLNCQRAYQPTLAKFLCDILENGEYDVLLLQEVDHNVLPFLGHPSYVLVRTLNEEIGKEIELCIVYRNSYKLNSTGFRSFAGMQNDRVHGYKHPTFGLLWADINIGDKAFRFGTLHLHSGMSYTLRMEELKIVKQAFKKDPLMHVILAGDYNSGYPGESRQMARLLLPEFHWLTKNIGYTLDGRYSENSPHILNKIARFLSQFGLTVPFSTDHFFIDCDTVEKCKAHCHVLKDRVSDHSPIVAQLEI